MAFISSEAATLANISRVCKDIDSLAVVSSSLLAYDQDLPFDIMPRGRRSYPTKNSKLIKLIDPLWVSRKTETWWCEFRLGGFSHGTVFVLFKLHNRAPIGNIRPDFLQDIVKGAATSLTLSAQSRLYNINRFCLEDNKSIKVFPEDWVAFARGVDDMLSGDIGDNFRDKHSIVEIYFYSCSHGLQSRQINAIDLILREFRIIRNSPHIEYAQAHVGTNFYAPEGQGLILNHLDAKLALGEPRRTACYRSNLMLNHGNIGLDIPIPQDIDLLLEEILTYLQMYNPVVHIVGKRGMGNFAMYGLLPGLGNIDGYRELGKVGRHIRTQLEQFRQFLEVTRNDFCIRVEEVRSTKNIHLLDEYYRNCGIMCKSASDILESGAVRLVSNWRAYVDETLSHHVKFLVDFVADVDEGKVVDYSRVVNAHKAETVILAFVFGQRFQRNKLYDSRLMRQLFDDETIKYGDVDYGRRGRVVWTDGNNDDDDDDDEFSDSGESEQSQGDRHHYESGEEYHGTDFNLDNDIIGDSTFGAFPALNFEYKYMGYTELPHYLTTLSRIRATEKEAPVDAKERVNFIMTLLVSFAQQILLGHCTERFNIETAFREVTARQYSVRHGNRERLIVKGTIVPSDIINNLLKPTTLIGCFIAAATNFAADIQLLRKELMTFIRDNVQVFPLALLTKDKPRSSWQNVFANKAALDYVPPLTAFDSTRYHQMFNLRGFKDVVAKKFTRNDDGTFCVKRVTQGTQTCANDLLLADVDEETDVVRGETAYLTKLLKILYRVLQETTPFRWTKLTKNRTFKNANALTLRNKATELIKNNSVSHLIRIYGINFEEAVFLKERYGDNPQ